MVLVRGMETTATVMYAFVIVMAILNALCATAWIVFVISYASTGDRDKAIDAFFRAMMNGAIAAALFGISTIFK